MSGLRSARGQVAAAIVLFLFLLGAISAVAVWSAHDHQSRLRSLEQRSQAATALESARSNFYMEAIGLLAGAFVPDPRLLQASTLGRAGLNEDLARARTALEAEGDTEAVLLLDDLTIGIERLQGTADQVSPIAAAGGTEVAMTLFPYVADTVQDSVTRLQDLADAQRAAFFSEEEAASQAANSALWALVALSMGAFLVAVGGAVALTSSVVRPLVSLRRTARAITSGDLESRAKVSGPEEVASVARSFNEMTETLAAKTREYIDTTNLTGDIIVRLDTDGRLAFLNDSACETFGKPREELLGTDARAFMRPEDIEAATKEVQKARESRGPVKGVVGRLVTPTGTRLVEWNGHPLFDEEGRYTGIQVTGRDITERRKAEKALAAKTEEYLATTNLTGDIILRVDRDSRCTFLNDAACQFFGRQREELLNVKLREYLHPEDLEPAVQAVKEMAQTKGLVRQFVNRWLTPLGTRVVEWNGYALLDEEGRYTGFQATGRDITERKEMEDALAANREEYVAITNLTSDIIGKVDEKGRWTFVNDAACEFFGRPREELLGTDSKATIQHEDVEATVQAVRKAAATGEPIEAFVNRQITPMGTRVLEWNASPFFDEQGTYAGIQMTGRDITDRKEAEEALRESEERFKTLFDFAPDAYYLNDLEGKFVDGNNAAEDLVGYKKDELVGKSFAEAGILAPDQLQRAVAILAKNARGLPSGPDELTLVRKDGSQVPVEIRTFPVRVGDHTFVLGIARDITEREQAQEALRESEEKYRRLVQDSADGIVILEGVEVRFVNQALLRMYGADSVEEVLGRPFADFVSPEHRELMAARTRARQKGGNPPNRYEFKALRQDGTEVDAEISVSRITYQGRPAVQGIVRDITERKRAEKVLRESEERFRSLSNSAPIGIFLTDVQGKCTYANPRLLDIAGLTLEESLGHGWLKVIHPDDRQTILEEANKAAGQERDSSYDIRIVTGEGKLHWAHIHTSPTFSAEGEVIGRVGAVEDITERKQMEEALAAKTKEYIDTVNMTGDIIVRLDKDGRFSFLNDAACRTFGKPREELLGRVASAFIHPEDLQAATQAVEETIDSKGDSKGPIRGFESRLVAANGTRVVAWNAHLLFDEEDEYAGIQITGHDITERKQMEEALRESEGQYRAIFEQAADSILLIDAESGAPVQFNDRAHQALGYDREEFEKIKIPDFEIPESPGEVAKHLENIVKAGADTFETRHRTKSGEIRNIEVRAKAISIRGRDFVQAIFHDITERKQMEEALRESEGRYRLLAENTSDLIWTMDLGLKYTYMSPAITQMRGYTVEEIMAQTVNESMTPASRDAAIKTLAEELAMERAEDKDVTRTRRLELEMYCKDGSTIWTEMHMKFLRHADGNPIGILGTTRDISERKQMEEALRESEVRYRLIAENASDLIWTMDLNLVYTYMSPSVEHMRGYKAEEIVGTRVSEAMTPASLEVIRKAFAEEMAMEKHEQNDMFRSRTLEAEMYCKDGSTVWTEIKMSFLRDPDGKPMGILGVTRDISERKKAEREREGLHAELELRAITDSLTGLYDHAHFYQRLAEEIDRSKRYKHGFAVVMMDVDDFKRFNDARGHQAGDKALRLVSYCIRSGLRRSDIAFRYGGDEFAAILPHADARRAGFVVNRINRHITKRLKEIDGGSLTRLSVSAGVACFPDDGTTADDLVRMADAALYNTKWVARARDIMGQREDIQSLVSALVGRRPGVEGAPSGTLFRPEALHEQQARIVASVASSIAVALKDAGVAQALEDPDLQVVATVGAAAEIKDRYIRGHPERTSEEAVTLAKAMGLSAERVRDIQIAGLLHDIGKVTVSEGILNKPGKLTRREFDSIKDHPIVGATLVSQVRGFERLVPIVRHHHERFDGNGYPDGLAREEIPLEARILSVVDVFDALTHQRSYREALDRGEAIAELERGAGTQFDPAVLEAFLALLKRRGDGSRPPAQAASEDRQRSAAKAPARGKR